MEKLESTRDRATIILVHGAFEHKGRYKELADRFRQDGFSVIYGDLPGQGLSDGKKGHIRSFGDYVETIQSWYEQADPDKKIFLLGHSMGGLAVIRFMEEKQPQLDGVILSSPAVQIRNKTTRPLEALSYLMNVFTPSLRMKAGQNPENVTRNQIKVEEFRQDPLVIDKVSVRWYREFQKAGSRAFQQVNRFPDVPLLVMQAEEDLLVDPARTKEWFNHVDTSEKSYKLWPGLYHEIFNEPENDQVYHYTQSFLSNIINER
ncbi:lysophospholipase [Halobacillus kuroshimensis]|uniref:Lysophospholipase n=1 Tax=Halobacillus kuroshimensis TaxID=302481 RepID=A0ABS3DW58_9BACI|nr:alpha/beta hydrolase [Halobacillus kuroshimensis]MBN8235566.1 lysophospholipase [Halobacillus kuroshimensis]